MTVMLEASGLKKAFTLHNQGGVVIPVFGGVDLAVAKGEAVVLAGPSGAGKSTLLRILYANYKPTDGHVRVRHRGQFVDLIGATAREVLEVRRHTLSFVSQFLRVIPRVSSLAIVAEPLVARGVSRAEAEVHARALLLRLNMPERLHALPPATFSGGEQQRVNLARGFAADYPVLLLDEPTASLDAANRAIVVALIDEAKARGAAIIGIFHDAEVRDRVADRLFTVQPIPDAA